MSYHIVSIDSPQCSLSCKDGQLVCKTADGQKSLPMEDIAAIVITSFSPLLHGQMLIEAARHRVALIICESFKPVSIVLPANRATDTFLTRAQFGIKESFRQKLWAKTVDAKCENQYWLAAMVSPSNPKVESLRSTAFGKQAHKESVCAREFWQIVGSLTAAGFERSRFGGGMNNLLNYGYAVLLSICLQKLMAVGFDPTFGISHVTRERCTPLAYDIMEPFRPYVDWFVIQWLQQQREGKHGEVTKEFRRWITGFAVTKVHHQGCLLAMNNCIETVIRSFRRSVFMEQVAFYKPWTPRSSKWAG